MLVSLVTLDLLCTAIAFLVYFALVTEARSEPDYLEFSGGHQA